MKVMKALHETAAVRLLPIVLMGAWACGPEAALNARLDAPEARESRITLTPALELTALESETELENIADRLVIEDIQLNLGDVRLLGADPSIPAGGLTLIDQERVVRAYGQGGGIDLGFPQQYLGDQDLAVYVRIHETPELDGASVVVRARLYESPTKGGASSLVASTVGATDPDGDPASDPDIGPDTVSATDPDGDPAMPEDCDDATDPDGDPARTRCQRDGLVRRGEADQNFVMVELRDERAADLVATLGDSGSHDVVVGIPAARWFTPTVVADLDAALDEKKAASAVESTERDATTELEAIVVHSDSRREHGRKVGGDRPSEDYFLSDAEELDRLTVRR